MNYIHILFTIIGFTLLVGCTNFVVENQNPDITSFEQIRNKPEFLLTHTQNSLIRRKVSDAWSDGNLMAQYAARIVFVTFDQFEWGSQSGTWENYFLNIRNAKELEKIALSIENPSYEAVALIIQTWLFSILTDMWGDIPYTEVNQAAEKNYTPKFDRQEDIYTSMLNTLEKANQLLIEPTPIKGDIFFQNDLLQWRKLANALRLRLALRLSQIKPELAQSTIQMIYNHPDKYPLILENQENAVYRFLNSHPNAHPNTEESTYRVGSYNEYRISEHFVDHLNKFNDPRLAFFADTVANYPDSVNIPFQGMKNGIAEGPAYTYKGGDPFLSKFNIKYFYFSPNQNEARILLASEVNFILAEAAQRNWINADAATFYEEGIRSNFEYWGIPLPNDYLTQETVKYNNTLERIFDQKYIALFYTDYQGFIEFKRTKLPKTIQPGPDAKFKIYPSRFEYPNSAQTLNTKNYLDAINRLANKDEITSKVWWEN